jgi:hypothetical protein
MRGFVDALLLWKLLQAFPKKNCLEIGSYQGLTTGLFFDSMPGCRVTSVDIIDHMDLFRKNYGHVSGQHHFILKSSTDVKLKENYDLILVDGNHSYEYAWADLQLSLQHLNQDALLLIDDYNFPGVAAAIKNLYKLNSDWVPFMQGIQLQVWHHASQTRDAFLDDLLYNSPIKNFLLIQNINDNYSNTILEAKSIQAVTDYYQVFDLMLDIYDI